MSNGLGTAGPQHPAKAGFGAASHRGQWPLTGQPATRVVLSWKTASFCSGSRRGGGGGLGSLDCNGVLGYHEDKILK